MQATFRPLQWTAATTPADGRRSRYTFKASWPSTLSLLDRELGYLDAENLIIQADFLERDLRLDGMPKANARQPDFPGVRILFDSKHGPLVYETDAYEFWQHNVRAIALALEALRAVDRYGVTHRAEQYKGWKAIESGGGLTTSEQARRTLRRLGGVDDGFHSDMALYRAAVKTTHPDQGGSREDWDLVQKAREVLGL